MVSWIVPALVLLLAAACVYGAGRFFAGYPRREAPLRELSRREAAFLDAAAEATFPAGGAVPLSGAEADLPGYVDRWFRELRGAKKLQMRLLFALMEHATLLFPAPGWGGRRRFSGLDVARREAVLRDWAESRLVLRRLVFTALRAVLTMGYLGHPRALRHLRLAPLDFETPVVEADLLYPRVGAPRSSIALGPADLRSGEPAGPLDPAGPLHPDYAGGRS